MSISIRIGFLLVLFAIVGCGKENPPPEADKGPPPPPADPPPPVAGWVQVGEIRVRVDKAKIAPIPYIRRNGGVEESKEPALMLWVSVENLSKSRKVEYHRWIASEGKLQDEHGNRYGNLSSGPIRAGHSTGDNTDYTGIGPIYPGEPPKVDVLCFEKPVSAATKLHLTLVGSRLGEHGDFKFEIPASAWK